MKCPFKLLHAPYDGGAECDPECALLMYWCNVKHTKVCSLALLANIGELGAATYKTALLSTPVNYIEEGCDE